MCVPLKIGSEKNWDVLPPIFEKKNEALTETLCLHKA